MYMYMYMYWRDLVPLPMRSQFSKRERVADVADARVREQIQPHRLVLCPRCISFYLRLLLRGELRAHWAARGGLVSRLVQARFFT